MGAPLVEFKIVEPSDPRISLLKFAPLLRVTSPAGLIIKDVLPDPSEDKRAPFGASSPSNPNPGLNK